MTQSHKQAHKAKSNTNPNVGDQYTWPVWNEKILGKSPTIRLAGEPGTPPSEVGAPPSKEDVKALNMVLENMVKMAVGAKADGPGTWKGNLKELSGLTIDIYPHNKNIAELSGRQENGNVAMLSGRAAIEQGPTTIETTHGPVIAFNPRTWAKYPVEGRSGEFSFASPEHLLMHESRHYVADKAFEKASADFGIKITTNNTGELIYESEKEMDNFSQFRYKNEIESHQKNTSESFVINAENLAMKSLDSDYKNHAFGVGGGSLMLEGKNGLPKVEAVEQEELVRAAKRSNRGAEPHSEAESNSKFFEKLVRLSADDLAFVLNQYATARTPQLSHERVQEIV